VNVYKVALLSPGGAYRVDAHVVSTSKKRALGIVEELIKISEIYKGATVGSITSLISIIDTEAFMTKGESA